ncbi:MAG: GNAT family N-acetyltransferase [Solirubrobacteraceae bacterium]
MAPIEVELLGSPERERAAEEWSALERRCEPLFACTWLWTETWLRHYGDAVPHEFALARRDGEALAVALVTRSARRAAGLPLLRRLHLGTAGEPGRGVWVERNGLLAREEDRPGAGAALLAALRRRGGWDELCLDGFAPDHAADVLAAAGPGGAEARREPSPVRRLAGARAAGGGALGALATGTRRRVRQGLRALDGARTEITAGGDRAMAFFDELVELHEARWDPGIFSDPRVLGFHRDLIARAGGAVWISRTTAPVGTVGCLYGFLESTPGGGVAALFYQSGLARFEDNRVRPGLVAHAGLIDSLIGREDVELVDYLAGESRYKRELADDERELVWARIGGAARRARLVRAAREKRRAVRRGA